MRSSSYLPIHMHRAFILPLAKISITQGEKKGCSTRQIYSRRKQTSAWECFWSTAVQNQDLPSEDSIKLTSRCSACLDKEGKPRLHGKKSSPGGIKGHQQCLLECGNSGGPGTVMWSNLQPRGEWTAVNGCGGYPQCQCELICSCW